VEWLEDKKIYKINPLLHWSFDDILNYIKAFSVPYNLLHDKGFVSIGCAPCTRAIEEGEDPRAGRWWWEVSQKECGLHLVK
jgi:phosphoadenosine phosphosulfate reductase